MKIILSRKGFDSESGGCASPILPNGRLLSLPIPDTDSNISYNDLKLDSSYSYFDIIKNLTKTIRLCGKNLPLTPLTKCHNDPDICKGSLKREDGWLPTIGQIGTAERHLQNNQISPGDLFLFFGWFRNTVMVNDRLVFDSNDREGRHIIFGYMQIEEILKVDKDKKTPLWMKDNPHVMEVRRVKEGNTIYIARTNLSWEPSISGAGTFKYDDSLVLTKKGYLKSQWDLPEFFKDIKISYHSGDSWKDNYFQSAARGQEFVMDVEHRNLKWAKYLIRRNYIREDKAVENLSL